MSQISFYVALLRSGGVYKVYIPSLRMEIPVTSPHNLDDELTEEFSSNGINPHLARQDAIMRVIHGTRKYLRLEGRSLEEFLDTVKVTIDIEEV